MAIGQRCAAVLTYLLMIADARASSDVALQRVRVTVRDAASDAPIAGSYVALVSPHLPASRPVAETLAADGTAWFDVPAGEYLILGGAPLHGFLARPSVQVREGERNHVELHLSRLRVVNGVVHDVTGKPLGGVTVSEINAAVEPTLGRLSALARDHIAREWRSVSNSDGRWSLSLPADSTNPIVAELAGHTLAWVPNAQAIAEGVDLTMRPGATLRANLDRVDPGFAVTLVAKNEAAIVPAAWQAQLWGRVASARNLEWSSLPPGTYDIYVKQLDPRAFAPATRGLRIAN